MNLKHQASAFHVRFFEDAVSNCLPRGSISDDSTPFIFGAAFKPLVAWANRTSRPLPNPQRHSVLRNVDCYVITSSQ